MSIFDKIKANAVPVGVMRSASKGALPIATDETLQILVFLTHNPVFAQEAKMTLARWDVASAIEVLGNPAAPPEVLSYFWMETNRRPVLMPTLIENPAIPESLLMELAAGGSREMVAILLDSDRTHKSPGIKEALAANPTLSPEEVHQLKTGPLPPAETETEAEPQAEPAPEAAAEPQDPASVEAAAEEGSHEDDPEVIAAFQAWHEEHAAEIAAEEGKPFELVGEDEEENQTQDPGPQHQPESETQPAAAASGIALAAIALGSAEANAKAKAESEKKLSALQKIARMNAAQRVKAAFSGGREERMILIRDGARVVQNSVLASPKITDPEIETFAAAKNVSENVLREIARNRRFMKNYNVARNLVNNAKCPLDLSLTLIKNLMIYDLKSLRFNKGVPETIRQVAAKLYREKSGPAREGKRK